MPAILATGVNGPVVEWTSARTRSGWWSRVWWRSRQQSQSVWSGFEQIGWHPRVVEWFLRTWIGFLEEAGAMVGFSLRCLQRGCLRIVLEATMDTEKCIQSGPGRKTRSVFLWILVGLLLWMGAPTRARAQLAGADDFTSTTLSSANWSAVDRTSSAAGTLLPYLVSSPKEARGRLYWVSNDPGNTGGLEACFVNWIRNEGDTSRDWKVSADGIMTDGLYPILASGDMARLQMGVDLVDVAGELIGWFTVEFLRGDFSNGTDEYFTVASWNPAFEESQIQLEPMLALTGSMEIQYNAAAKQITMATVEAGTRRVIWTTSLTALGIPANARFRPFLGVMTYNDVGSAPSVSLGFPMTQVLLGRFMAFDNFKAETAQPPALPVVVRNPSNQTINAGGTANFSAEFSGTITGYRWQRRALGSSEWVDIFNSDTVSGASGTFLTLNGVEQRYSGDAYRLSASNAGGTAFTQPALLTVTAPAVAPVITTQPVNVAIQVGADALFTVAASGTPGPTYRWQRQAGGVGAWQNLTEGGGYTGVQTAALLVRAVALAMSGDRFKCVVQNTAGTVESAVATLRVDPATAAPGLTLQPINQTVTEGGTATFRVGASGIPAPQLRWQRRPVGASAWADLTDGTAYSGTGSDTLRVVGVLRAMSGDAFRAVAMNGVGNPATSQIAVLTVTTTEPAARVVRVVGSTVSPGGDVQVPVQLISNGDENTIAFTLVWEPGILTLGSLTAGADAGSASLTVNTNLAGQGKAGVLIALPAGARHRAGTNELLRVGFRCSPGTAGGAGLEIGFADDLGYREVVSTEADVLAARFEAGIVTVNAGIEGDLQPRPSGDLRVTAADYTFMDRLVVGNVPVGDLSASEFVRADCAPRTSAGDGRITATDRVQAARFALGLDALVPAGGPGRAAGSSRAVGLSGTGDAERGLALVVAGNVTERAASVQVEFNAAGDENTLAFSIEFDPAHLRYLRTSSTNLPAGATLLSNPNQSVQGRIGFLLALPAGQVFARGNWVPMVLDFEVLPGVAGTVVSFGDIPVLKEVVSPEAEVLAATFSAVQITVRNERPELGSPEVFAGFEVRGMPGRRYRIERSPTGLGNDWVLAGEVVLEESRQLWIDVNQGARGPAGFYRVVEVP